MQSKWLTWNTTTDKPFVSQITLSPTMPKFISGICVTRSLSGSRTKLTWIELKPLKCVWLLKDPTSIIVLLSPKRHLSLASLFVSRMIGLLSARGYAGIGIAFLPNTGIHYRTRSVCSSVNSPLGVSRSRLNRRGVFLSVYPHRRHLLGSSRQIVSEPVLAVSYCAFSGHFGRCWWFQHPS